jgi:hypothetical protein
MNQIKKWVGKSEECNRHNNKTNQKEKISLSAISKEGGAHGEKETAAVNNPNSRFSFSYIVRLVLEAPSWPFKSPP